MCMVGCETGRGVVRLYGCFTKEQYWGGVIVWTRHIIGLVRLFALNHEEGKYVRGRGRDSRHFEGN
jgi:hypothetical protein